MLQLNITFENAPNLLSEQDIFVSYFPALDSRPSTAIRRGRPTCWQWDESYKATCTVIMKLTQIGSFSLSEGQPFLMVTGLRQLFLRFCGILQYHLYKGHSITELMESFRIRWLTGWFLSTIFLRLKHNN